MKSVKFERECLQTSRAVGDSECGGLSDGVGLASVGDLSGLRAESGERGDDLGHVGGSGAVLGVIVGGRDGGRGETSHSGGSDSSGETHFDIE